MINNGNGMSAAAGLEPLSFLARNDTHNIYSTDLRTGILDIAISAGYQTKLHLWNPTSGPDMIGLSKYLSIGYIALHNHPEPYHTR